VIEPREQFVLLNSMFDLLISSGILGETSMPGVVVQSIFLVWTALLEYMSSGHVRDALNPRSLYHYSALSFSVTRRAILHMISTHCTRLGRASLSWVGCCVCIIHGCIDHYETITLRANTTQPHQKSLADNRHRKPPIRALRASPHPSRLHCSCSTESSTAGKPSPPHPPKRPHPAF